MGYFASGSEGDAYSFRYCERCRHNDDGCVVMDLHMLWNYEQGDGGDKRIALETFIPTGDNGWPMQCAMFLPIDEAGQ